jgi:NADH/NAD ratio-sensing transcriptional regulator Rex
MEGEDIIEVEYCMSELVDMALGQRIEPASLDLTIETVNPLDVDERPPPIVKLTDAQQHAQQHAQLLVTFFMDHSLDFTPAYLMKLQGILEKLNKIYVANLKWQHQRNIDSFFKST